MKVSDFDFDLPEGLIALRPCEPREAARLLHVDPQKIHPFSHFTVNDLPSLVNAGDALVFNDTRVIPARLFATRQRGDAAANIEIMLHMRKDEARWQAFLRPAKKVAAGEKLHIHKDGQVLTAILEERHEGGDATLLFDRSGIALDDAIARLGAIPLPPYIESKRPVDDRDRMDYQTAYARAPGAVAAPTAGLHFTPDLLRRLKTIVDLHFLTLHVGAGTFLPVKAEDTRDHVMHAEYGVISEETAISLNAVRERGGRIIAIGTTSLRLLESAADAKGTIHAFAGDTSIFITPGYRFRAVDGLMTNFHLPQSTLFMLVSAFAGQAMMKRAYEEAIMQRYRFYSYGDSSLLWRAASE
jgi:S-adenosylmethionine:tRNA ribosyltransferase-isomerase